MSARSSRLSASTVGILLAAAILLGVNYLASRHWKRFDWTRAQVYSLSETTKKTLDALKTPVQVTVFMTPRSRLATEVKELLSRYQARSPKIEVEYLDPERNPARGEVLFKESGAKVGTVASARATAGSTSRRTSSPTSTTPERAWAERRASRPSRARRRSLPPSCR